MDSDCRVNAVRGLGVVDASVMPRVTTGNLNAPTVMIAEKIADHLRGRALAATNVPFCRSTP